MASVTKRPDGRWRARYRDAAHREHARHFSRKVDAQQWLDEVTAAVVTGQYVDPAAGRMTVAAYAPTWLDRQVQLKPSTAERYASILRTHVVPTFGSLKLSEVEHSAVASWVTELSSSRLAAPTVRHVHRVLYMVFASAMRDGKLVRNPAAGVKLPRDHRREMRFLSHEEVDALATAAGDDALIILVLAYCGLRFGELAALRVRDVDPLRRRLTVEQSATEVRGRIRIGPPKSYERRSVPIRRSLLEAVVEKCAGKQPDALVFTGPAGGVIWLRNWRRRTYNPAVRAAGLQPLTTKQLRNTAASLAVASGANVKAVQRMLGHASAAITLDVYSGLFDDDLDAVADRLDDAAARARNAPAADFLRTDAEMIRLSDRRRGAGAQ